MTHESILPVFQHPFHLNVAHGEFATVELDSADDLEQSIMVILLTEIGQRIEMPEYGVRDMLFDTSVDTSDILARIAEWEPRALTMIETNVDALDNLVRRLHVRIQQEVE